MFGPAASSRTARCAAFERTAATVAGSRLRAFPRGRRGPASRGAPIHPRHLRLQRSNHVGRDCRLQRALERLCLLGALQAIGALAHICASTRGLPGKIDPRVPFLRLDDAQTPPSWASSRGAPDAHAHGDFLRLRHQISPSPRSKSSRFRRPGDVVGKRLLLDGRSACIIYPRPGSATLGRSSSQSARREAGVLALLADGERELGCPARSRARISRSRR